MNRKFMMIIFLLGLGCMCSCSSSGIPLHLQERMSQTSVFGNSCREQNVQFPEVAKADSLADSAQSYKSAGKNEEAFRLFDRAVILYRLALANFDLEESRQELERGQAALREALLQLSIYEEIHDELKKQRGGTDD